MQYWITLSVDLCQHKNICQCTKDLYISVCTLIVFNQTHVKLDIVIYYDVSKRMTTLSRKNALLII